MTKHKVLVSPICQSLVYALGVLTQSKTYAGPDLPSRLSRDYFPFSSKQLVNKYPACGRSMEKIKYFIDSY